MALNSEKTTKAISRVLLTVIAGALAVTFLWLMATPIQLRQDLTAKQVVIDSMQVQHKRDSSQMVNMLQLFERASKGTDTIFYENRVEKRRYMIQFIQVQ